MSDPIFEANCPGCTRVISRYANRCPYCTCEIETVQVGKGTDWAYKQGWLIGILCGGFGGGMIGIFFYHIGLGALIGAGLCGWLFSTIGKNKGLTVRRVKDRSSHSISKEEARANADKLLGEKLPVNLMARYGVSQEGDGFLVNGIHYVSITEACLYAEKLYFAKHGITRQDDYYYYQGLPYPLPSAVFEKVDEELAKNLKQNELEKDVINDDALWEKAAQELASGERKEGLWAKCFAQAQGDEDRAKAFYYTARVKQLSGESEGLEKVIEAVPTMPQVYQDTASEAALQNLVEEKKDASEGFATSFNQSNNTASEQDKVKEAPTSLPDTSIQPQGVAKISSFGGVSQKYTFALIFLVIIVVASIFYISRKMSYDPKYQQLGECYANTINVRAGYIRSGISQRNLSVIDESLSSFEKFAKGLWGTKYFDGFEKGKEAEFRLQEKYTTNSIELQRYQLNKSNSCVEVLKSLTNTLKNDVNRN